MSRRTLHVSNVSLIYLIRKYTLPLDDMLIGKCIPNGQVISFVLHDMHASTLARYAPHFEFAERIYMEEYSHILNVCCVEGRGCVSSLLKVFPQVLPRDPQLHIKSRTC